MLDCQRKVAKACDVEGRDGTEQHGIKFMVDSSLMRDGIFLAMYCVYSLLSPLPPCPSTHTRVHYSKSKKAELHDHPTFLC